MTTVNAIMPNLGTNMEKGTITKWIKKEGDKIVKGEPLFEIMTENPGTGGFYCSSNRNCCNYRNSIRKNKSNLEF